MRKPLLGEQAICGMCRERIVYIGPYWDHMGDNKPRHPAVPEDEWMQKPPTKEQAFNAFLAELVAAGVSNQTPIIEALYVYREALLQWQREVIDGHARDAELAIGVLRGYTRGGKE